MLRCIFGNETNFKRKSTNTAKCYLAMETVAAVHQAKSLESKAVVAGNAWQVVIGEIAARYQGTQPYDV